MKNGLQIEILKKKFAKLLTTLHNNIGTKCSLVDENTTFL